MARGPMRFADPLFLGLLAIPLWWLLARWRAGRRPPESRLAFPVLRFLDSERPSWRARLHGLPTALGFGALLLFIAALARPQLPGQAEPTRIRSRNIVLALDISSSMKATDFQPGNRLTVAREVVRQFIRRRQGDLMGLVVFAGRAFLQAPLTSDGEVLDRLVEQVDLGMLPDGTAIGTALALGLNQLKNLPRQACAIVLITDGANNTGEPSPAAAGEVAHALGIRVHAIGLSSPDTAATALNGVWSVRTLAARLSGRDEAALKRIAARTGGQYYRATDPAALEKVLEEIDPLERIEVRVNETRRYHEIFPGLAATGLVFLLGALVLRGTWLRTLLGP